MSLWRRLCGNFLENIDYLRDKLLEDFNYNLRNNRSDDACYLYYISGNLNCYLYYDIPLAEIALKHIGVHALVVGVDGGVGCVGFDYLALVYQLFAVDAVGLESERVLRKLDGRIARLFGDIFKIKPLVIVILDTVLAGSGARGKVYCADGIDNCAVLIVFLILVSFMKKERP